MIEVVFRWQEVATDGPLAGVKAVGGGVVSVPRIGERVMIDGVSNRVVDVEHTPNIKGPNPAFIAIHLRVAEATAANDSRIRKAGQ